MSISFHFILWSCVLQARKSAVKSLQTFPRPLAPPVASGPPTLRPPPLSTCLTCRQGSTIGLCSGVYSHADWPGRLLLLARLNDWSLICILTFPYWGNLLGLSVASCSLLLNLLLRSLLNLVGVCQWHPELLEMEGAWTARCVRCLY